MLSTTKCVRFEVLGTTHQSLSTLTLECVHLILKSKQQFFLRSQSSAHLVSMKRLPRSEVSTSRLYLSFYECIFFSVGVLGFGFFWGFLIFVNVKEERPKKNKKYHSISITGVCKAVCSGPATLTRYPVGVG